MKKLTLLLTLAALVVLSACSPEEPVPSPSPLPSPPPTETAPPQDLVWQDQIFDYSEKNDDGVALYTAHFLLPGVVNAHLSPAWTAINDYYYTEGQAYLDTARETALLAVDDYEVTAALGYDFPPYAEESYYSITLQTDSLISIRRTYYSSLGGAYPGNFQFSEVFALSDGRRLTLADLFPDRAALLELVRSEATKREGLDLTNLETVFNDKYFYLTEDSLVLYFQEGDLGPRAAGLPEFSLSLDTLGGLPQW